jgi:hypothetical protein
MPTNSVDISTNATGVSLLDTRGWTMAHKHQDGTVVLYYAVQPNYIRRINAFARDYCNGTFKLKSIKGDWYVIENSDRHSSEWSTRAFHDGMRLCLLHARGG